jgi:beta-N-acetylhexosaminidase
MRVAKGIVALGASVMAAAGCSVSQTTTQTSTSSPARALTTAAQTSAATATSDNSLATAPTAASQASSQTATSSNARATATVLRRASEPPRPRIVWDPIPFGPRRKAEMAAYAARHYGSFMRPTWRLVHPHVIVIHFTETPDFRSTYNTFAPDAPDVELHELPGTCAHFVIDQAGAIHQLVSLGVMCRHTVGLNWTAIGIEHVGFSDAQVLGDRRQISASLRLVRWLRCRFHIPVRNVIGHNESLTSPYHHEDVASLRTQTHSDFNHADMETYRSRLRQTGGCA